MSIERLTTSLQFIGAALALPAGAAGVYSAYHNYFSPEVMCQEMRNSTLATLEKNIPAEAKHVLLRKEAGQFEAKCAEIEPETNTIFQVALQELEKPAAAPGAARKSGAVPRPAAVTALASPEGALAPAERVANANPLPGPRPRRQPVPHSDTPSAAGSRSKYARAPR
jgi:hypothetical protein